jgi:hypothetical protein
MMVRKIRLMINEQEVCSYNGDPPPEGRLIHIEDRLAGIGGRYRVAAVVETYSSSDSHLSVIAQQVGGMFQVTPGPVEVYLEQIHD